MLWYGMVWYGMFIADVPIWIDTIHRWLVPQTYVAKPLRLLTMYCTLYARLDVWVRVSRQE